MRIRLGSKSSDFAAASIKFSMRIIAARVVWEHGSPTKSLQTPASTLVFHAHGAKVLVSFMLTTAKLGCRTSDRSTQKWDSVSQDIYTTRKDALQAAVFESADFDLTPESYDLLDEALLGRPPCHTAASRYEYFYQARIDWSYTIDLDNEVFSINRGTHCRLREIPRYSAWKDFIATDGCYVPHDTLVNVVPDLRRNALEPSILGGCRFRVVMAKDIHHFDKQRLHSPLLVSALWKQFSRLHGVTIGNHLRSWKPEDFAFREYAHVILCLASRAPQRMRLFDFRRFRGCLRKGWLGPVEGEDPNSEDIDVVSDFGVGCHPEGIEPGSAPETTVYWFEGVLIVLVAELCRGGDLTLFRDGMAKILETAQSECQSHFNAVLLSIEDVVLVRVFWPDTSNTARPSI